MGRSAASCFAVLTLGSSAITTEMQETLDQHNVYRCMHGLPGLAWDDEIAAKAQRWANNGQLVHSPDSFRDIDGVQCGENLAFGTHNTGASSVKQWYKEIQYTD